MWTEICNLANYVDRQTVTLYRKEQLNRWTAWNWKGTHKQLRTVPYEVADAVKGIGVRQGGADDDRLRTAGDSWALVDDSGGVVHAASLLDVCCCWTAGQLLPFDQLRASE